MCAEKKMLGIRVPREIKEWLESQAEKNGRSVSGEALYRFRKMMEAEQKNVGCIA